MRCAHSRLLCNPVHGIGISHKPIPTTPCTSSGRSGASPGRPLRLPSVLFPVLKRIDGDFDPFGEFVLGEVQEAPERDDVVLGASARLDCATE
jgi:hypothetical protein